MVSLILAIFILLGGLGSFVYGCSKILTSLIYWTEGPVTIINGEFYLVGFWGVAFGLTMLAIGVLEFAAGGTLATNSMKADNQQQVNSVFKRCFVLLGVQAAILIVYYAIVWLYFLAIYNPEEGNDYSEITIRQVTLIVIIQMCGIIYCFCYTGCACYKHKEVAREYEVYSGVYNNQASQPKGYNTDE